MTIERLQDTGEQPNTPNYPGKYKHKKMFSLNKRLTLDKENIDDRNLFNRTEDLKTTRNASKKAKKVKNKINRVIDIA